MSVIHGPHHIVPNRIKRVRKGKKERPKIQPRCVANFFMVLLRAQAPHLRGCWSVRVQVIRDENGRSLPQITHIGLWILCNLWIDLDVEVAIDLERFDLFGEFESLLCFGRRYLRFLAVDHYSQRHRETFDDAFVVK